MRGTITRRGKAWQIKYDLPRDNGVRRQRYATVTGTYRDAQKKLTRLLGAVDAGTHVDPSQMTLAEYLHAWFEGAPKVSLKTARDIASLPTGRSSRTWARSSFRSFGPSTSSSGMAPCSRRGCRRAPSATPTGS